VSNGNDADDANIVDVVAEYEEDGDAEEDDDEGDSVRTEHADDVIDRAVTLVENPEFPESDD
jgi:hypothetical protein